MFYPDISASFKAWVAELDGRPEGVIGIALHRPVACAFSQFNEPLRPYLKHPAILRLIKKMQEAARASVLPVQAIAEKSEPTSRRMLERLGFRYAGQVDGEAVFMFKRDMG